MFFIGFRGEELVFLIELVAISAKHSVLVQNWNCRELLYAGPELVLVFYSHFKNGKNWYWYFIYKIWMVRIGNGMLLVSKSRQCQTLAERPIRPYSQFHYLMTNSKMENRHLLKTAHIERGSKEENYDSYYKTCKYILCQNWSRTLTTHLYLWLVSLISLKYLPALNTCLDYLYLYGAIFGNILSHKPPSITQNRSNKALELFDSLF